MLQLVCRSFTYPSAPTPALKAISLDVPHGQVVGLVGPNGAGKSTLCLVLAGLAPAVVGGRLDGLLRIDGEAVTGRPIHEVAQRVGLVIQNPSTQMSGLTRSVREEIAFGPMNLGLSRNEVLDRVASVVDLLDLGAIADQDPSRLSGGQTQLVVIGSILAMRPEHLILDEPTSQLDPTGVRLVEHALRTLAEAGTALLIAEHRTDLLDSLADRIVGLVDGTVIVDGPPRAELVGSRADLLGIAEPTAVRLARLCQEEGSAVSDDRIRRLLAGPSDG